MLRRSISVMVAGLLIVAAIVIVVLRPEKVGVVAAAFCLLAGLLGLYECAARPAAQPVGSVCVVLHRSYQAAPLLRCRQNTLRTLARTIVPPHEQAQGRDHRPHE